MPVEYPEPSLSADEALRLFNILKSDRRSSPHAVQVAWEAYVDAAEREMEEKRVSQE